MVAKQEQAIMCEVEFSEERDYGAIKVRYGLKREYEMKPEFTLLHARIELKDAVYSMFADYEANELPKTQQHQYKETVEKSSESDNWQKAIKFSKNVKGGKTYFNVITPRFPKFGIAAWDECVGRDKMIEMLGTKDEITLDGYRVLVDESGKYPKAIRFDLLF